MSGTWPIMPAKAYNRATWQGPETNTSCKAAETKNTTNVAAILFSPKFKQGKKTCRTSQLCTGRFQSRQYSSNFCAFHQSL